MKTLKERLFDSDTYSQVDEKKGKQISTKALKEFIAENEYAIIIQRYRMKQYIFDSYPEYCVDPLEIYILEAGDDTIAKEYGQAKYNSQSLQGQDIDGTWRSSDCATNKALSAFAERTGFDSTKPHNPYDSDDYMVWFYKSEWLEKFMKGKKIFDTRNLIKS